MKNILLFTLLVFVSQILGQTKNQNSGYLSIQGGNYFILSDNFETLYNSKHGFVIGPSFGIPISKRFSLYVSASYFQKEGELLIDDNADLRENNLLKQLIVDAGFEINLFPKSFLNFYVQSGLTFAFIDEERKNTNGGFIYETEGTGNYGIFGGAVLELNLFKSPISLISEYKYYYSWKPHLNFEKEYRAQKITFGVRLYFSDRWK